MTHRASRAGWTAVLLAAFAAASTHAAPLGTILFEHESGPSTLSVRIDGASIRGESRGNDGVWTLVVSKDGPRLETGSSTELVAGACDASLFATLSTDDADGDGRIDARRHERARLLVAANWRVGQQWRSAILAVELGAAGTATLAWRNDSTDMPALGRLAAAPARLTMPPAGDAGDAIIVAGGWPRSDMPVAGGSAGSLLAFDAATGRALPMLFTTDANLVSGVTMVDGDGDGATDRLYFADARWRVWRLDRTSSPPGATAAFFPTLFADLGTMAEPGAALQFAPDVALAEVGAPRMLEVALGSSDVPGSMALRHWLFVLSDPLPLQGAIDVAIASSPIRPSDLLPSGVAGKADEEVATASRGKVISLPGPLATAPITVAGHRLVATRASAGKDRCTLRVDEPELFDLLTLTPTFEQRSYRIGAERDAAFSLSRSTAADGRSSPRLVCALGSTPLPQCPRIDAVQRDYWVRKDAR